MAAAPPAAAKQFNKVALLLAGRRFVPLWAALHHRGRRSGKAYVVPVAVTPTDTTFLIALPWGRGTDWVRNVRAAGECTIRWRGHDYACSEPEFVGQEVARAAARGVTAFALNRGDFPHGFIQLTRRSLG
jgi:deazaflavin-dependent oxidoreductase (nitroreductase family)